MQHRPAPSPEELRAKYREERDKRLSVGGRGILELEGDLAAYFDDPYTTPTPRHSVHDEVDVTVVGAGLGGLMIGAALRTAGVDRVRLIDQAGDVGGVWYWNRYPGVACDVEAAIYLPMLEEVGRIPADKYACGPDILAHAQSIAREFDLYSDALLHTTVTGAEWQEATAQWSLTTDRGDGFRSTFIVLANGPLQRLKLPQVPGIETFEGVAFHTSRWNFAYTGGSAVADPTELRDKVVGVVGTGATAIQCVPPLGRASKALYVFQRTPSTVAVRDNGPVDADWLASLKPGWQAERRRNFTSVLYGGDVEEDLVRDGWTQIFRALKSDPRFSRMTPEEAARARELADIELMEAVRARIDATVRDPATAEALKPYYPYLCKRPAFHDEYLKAFNLPNVHLVDTQGRGIERVTSRGVVANGREFELDCLIFATGFEVGTAFTRRIGFDVVGKDGLRLSEKWASGYRSLHGLMTAGFPNMLFQPTPNHQGTTTANFVDMMQENAQHIAYIVSRVRSEGATHFEVSQSAEDAWVATIIEKAPDDAAFLEACTPGRWNNEGRTAQRPPASRDYGDGPLAFFSLLSEWRASGAMPGLRLFSSPRASASDPQSQRSADVPAANP